MDRTNFIKLTAILFGGLFMSYRADILKDIDPDMFYFEDDGKIPNSRYPVLVYHQTFQENGMKGAEWLEDQFYSNNWSNSWRWGVYSYHHYHSNTHEVLGVFSGNAVLQLGGEKGKKLKVEVGDIIVIPAGVGHKNVNCSTDFTVVGAYPGGLRPDLMKGFPEEREVADRNLKNVQKPQADPLLGDRKGLIKYWK